MDHHRCKDGCAKEFGDEWCQAFGQPCLLMTELKLDAARLQATVNNFNKPEKLNDEQKAVLRLCAFVMEL